MKQLNAKADLQDRFLREVPCARRVGVDVAESHRWKAERRIFSLTAGDVEEFPLFQFADGQPIAAMHEILAFFSDLSDWQIALWFFARNAWLQNAAPMDVLRRDAQAVIGAARHAVEPIEG